MSNRQIKRVAILGSGVMGSRIACHFANAGLEVDLLDIVSPNHKDSDSKKERNALVDGALSDAIKSKPSPLFHKSYAQRIKTGNFDDDIARLAKADWIIEAIIENVEIKKSLFEKVEKVRKPGTIISTNTSGIPIHTLIEGRSEDFIKHFCGTHFFNPPRYLQLLEIIPHPTTDPEVISFLEEFGTLFLGKTTVKCKDTPAFIANRVGVLSIMAVFQIMEDLDLTIEEVDFLTGPHSGKPKSATFRTADVIGLDTLAKVVNNMLKDLPDDKLLQSLKLPKYVETLIETGRLGSKTKKGFYFKDKNSAGKKDILTLDIKTLEYRDKQRVDFPIGGMLKTVDSLADKIKLLHKDKTKAGEFTRKQTAFVLKYVSDKIPEISDEIFQIDDALRAGFGWELGPFQIWDILGIETGIKLIEEAGFKAADWVKDFAKGDKQKFYSTENGYACFDIKSQEYKPISNAEGLIILDNIREKSTVWSNSGANLIDVGDGVVNLEFRTKMNTMGGEVLEAINKSIELAEKNFAGLVIGNDSPTFTAGANLGMIFMMAIEQEYDELSFAISYFQNTMMRLRYSSIPVIAAPKGLCLGGGSELLMHSDAVVAGAESYIGLVEVGAGVIPGGGGTKEMALRASDHYQTGEVEFPELQRRYMAIAQAQVSTSAREAFDTGILRPGIDEVVMNSSLVLAHAKAKVLDLYDSGYLQPIKREDIKVLGRSGLSSFYTGAHAFMLAKYMSEHDKLISKKLAYVICGGDLTSPQRVSEQYLLDLERETFLSLLTEKKSLERMESILKTGKPLRN